MSFYSTLFLPSGHSDATQGYSVNEKKSTTIQRDYEELRDRNPRSGGEKNDWTHLPKRVYVSGMPLLLRGWNGRYDLKWSKEEEGGSPEYHLRNHSYWGIDIIHTVFEVVDESTDSKCEWVLRRSCDTLGTFYKSKGSKGSKGSKFPTGDWGWFVVTPEKEIGMWWRNNSQIISPLFFLVIFLVSSFYMMYSLFKR